MESIVYSTCTYIHTYVICCLIDSNVYVHVYLIYFNYLYNIIYSTCTYIHTYVICCPFDSNVCVHVYLIYFII